MQNNDKGHPAVGRHFSKKFFDRFYASGGGADTDSQEILACGSISFIGSIFLSGVFAFFVTMAGLLPIIL
jgi:hypothetical protein